MTAAIEPLPADATPDMLDRRLRANFDGVRAAIEAAADRAGRPRDAIRLVVVTKTVAAAVVARLPALGATDLGENRVQEALGKRKTLSDLPVRWHMIGKLQSNKVRRAFEMFHLVHSVDRPSLMEALSREAVRRGRDVEALLQVDLDREETKGGVAPEDAEEALARARSLPGLVIRGLMAIPAPVEVPEEARPAFRRLRELRDALRTSPEDLTELSMGMSHDFTVAVEEGATLVRVGSAVFAGLPPALYGRSTVPLAPVAPLAPEEDRSPEAGGA